MKVNNCPSIIDWLTKRNIDELANIYCVFNANIWPNTIPNEYKPYWWDITKNNCHYESYNHLERMVGFIKVVLDYCAFKCPSHIIKRKWYEVSN